MNNHDKLKELSLIDFNIYLHKVLPIIQRTYTSSFKGVEAWLKEEYNKDSFFHKQLEEHIESYRNFSEREERMKKQAEMLGIKY